MGTPTPINDLRMWVRTPAAKIPTNCKDVKAEILGVDSNSYFYISFVHPSNSDSYGELMARIEKSVKGKSCVTQKELSYEEQHGFPCIVKYPGRRGGRYSRAKIIEATTDENPDLVTCLLTDDFKMVQVHRSEVFHTDPDVKRIPSFALKCELNGMSCFVGYPLLKRLYEEFLGGSGMATCLTCVAQVINQKQSVPVVELLLHNGRDLAHVFQDLLPTTTQLKYPNPNVPMPIRIVHCNKFAKIWFQYSGRDQLIRLITDKLSKFQPIPVEQIKFPKCEPDSWKISYFSGMDNLFILKELGGNYRVRILDRFLDGTARVSFVDMGWTDCISQDNLYPLYTLDPNLCFIAPQCLSAALSGLVGKFDEDNPFDKQCFLSLIKINPLHLVVKGYRVEEYDPKIKGFFDPLVDIFIRSRLTPKFFTGHSLVETITGRTISGVDRKLLRTPGDEEDCEEEQDVTYIRDTESEYADSMLDPEDYLVVYDEMENEVIENGGVYPARGTYYQNGFPELAEEVDNS